MLSFPETAHALSAKYMLIEWDEEVHRWTLLPLGKLSGRKLPRQMRKGFLEYDGAAFAAIAFITRRNSYEIVDSMLPAHQKKAVAILEEARERIEKGWTQGAFARNSVGDAVNEDSEQACAWCVTGALMAAPRIAVDDAARFYLHKAIASIDDASQHSLASWNDAPDRTQEEVLAAFDAAIKIARSSRAGATPRKIGSQKTYPHK